LERVALQAQASTVAITVQIQSWQLLHRQVAAVVVEQHKVLEPQAVQAVDLLTEKTAQLELRVKVLQVVAVKTVAHIALAAAVALQLSESMEHRV
jgi:ABC-type Fe2+-enterobactin transport system substrate-binding protein